MRRRETWKRRRVPLRQSPRERKEMVVVKERDDG
jgi:hypothetical protein